MSNAKTNINYLVCRQFFIPPVSEIQQDIDGYHYGIDTVEYDNQVKVEQDLMQQA